MKNMNHSHKRRNAKTSMLFTIALAYLVFSSSSLILIGNLIIGAVKSFLGADVFVSSLASENNLPEQTLRDFLVKETSKTDSYVESYSFMGMDFYDY